MNLRFNLKRGEAEGGDVGEGNLVAVEGALAVDELNFRVAFGELYGRVEHDVGKEIPKSDRKGAVPLLALNIERRASIDVGWELIAAEPRDLVGVLTASRVMTEKMLRCASVYIEHEEVFAVCILITIRKGKSAERGVYIAQNLRAILQGKLTDLGSF